MKTEIAWHVHHDLPIVFNALLLHALFALQIPTTSTEQDAIHAFRSILIALPAQLPVVVLVKTVLH